MSPVTLFLARGVHPVVKRTSAFAATSFGYWYWRPSGGAWGLA